MARPTKLTPELKKQIIDYVRDGVSFHDACMALGIDESTLYKWKQRGKIDKSGRYFEFLKGIKQAEHEAKVWRILTVAKGEKEDPRLALEMLARKYPNEFARKDRHEISGADGKPIKIEFVGDWQGV